MESRHRQPPEAGRSPESRLLGSAWDKSISPETARHLLDLSFSRSHQQQGDALSQKARAGSLTPAERAELDEFIRVADLLAILQSRARQALKRAGLAT